MRSDSDDYLVRYLLGDVPPDEAERLDERSITDDEFAQRLRALENDLVDRIARGEAPGVSSPYLRDKVRFAEALYTLASSNQRTAGLRAAGGGFARAGLAAAAILVVALAGYLALRNMWLGDEIEHLQSDRAAIERQNAALRQELERAALAPTARAAPLSATVLLPPPRRGLRNEATILSMPKATEQVQLRLQLESDSHAIFWAALREIGSSRIVWRSPDLSAAGTGSERTVTLVVPASIFSAQLYAVELTGASSTGSADLLAHYPVRVVLE